MTLKTKNVVFVNISSDLYGSSKALMSLIIKLKDNAEFNPIVCLPDTKGPLAQKLHYVGVEIVEMPVVKLTRSMLKSFGFIKLYREYKQSKSIFEKAIDNRKIHCIHSNTLATLFGAFYCNKRKIKHIIHVHEIMEKPRYIKFFFTWLQILFADTVVYNSMATDSFYTKISKQLKNKSTMIYNGIDRHQDFLGKDERSELRKTLLGVKGTDVCVGLIGRINRLKGHKLLLDAYKKIKLEHPETKICFIGSPPDGQDHFLKSIKEKIFQEKIADVIILPFQENIYRIIDILDVIVIPSTEPESFGIIAVEAMLSLKVVVASDLGGLKDVIKDNHTGILFEPNNVNELTKSLGRILENQELKLKLEENAMIDAKKRFSSQTMAANYIKLLRRIK